jgi:ADP-ribosylglycohydrolase
MIGAIIGDIAGSTYEFIGNKNVQAPLFPPGSTFTDDTVMLVATADALLHGREFAAVYRAYGARFPAPKGGYGARFHGWLRAPDPRPYGSWGNGAAMRVAPIGWAFATWEETIRVAEQSAAVTHNHPEGMKGAAATAAAIWLARTGASKAAIRAAITKTFGYDLTRTCDAIRPGYTFHESAQQTVPEAIIAFLDSTHFAEAIQLAISLGGDADTLACITGGIAQAFYREIPDALLHRARELVDPALLRMVEAFNERFAIAN